MIADGFLQHYRHLGDLAPLSASVGNQDHCGHLTRPPHGHSWIHALGPVASSADARMTTEPTFAG